MTKLALVLACVAVALSPSATPAPVSRQELPQWRDLFNGKDLTGWVNVNTGKDTWSVRDGMIISTGLPMGVMRTEKQYENFLLHIEWMHLVPGGNSGCFAWSGGTPEPGKPFPKGLEVQMLELEWPKLNPEKDGTPRTDAYVHGELFGVNGMTIVPDNPRGPRSKSVENRCKPKGEWNVYDAVFVDGTVKLAVNGKFVNGISKASQKRGYLSLEAEGAEIHFRNIRIMELLPGVTTPEQSAAVVEK
jgi:hypothetical protein